ncbi:MAG: 30S ribosomal protein S14 [Legionella sp.]|nr:30S ribosomal protein S14 [Legionella sp.]
MAKKSILARASKRDELVKKHQQKRLELKRTMRLSDSIDEVMQLQMQLSKLPLNSSAVRNGTRCQQCGRARAVYRKFGLCRICLRQQLMTGNIAGGKKSSW